MANKHAYTSGCYYGSESVNDGRPIFAIIALCTAFEGVLSFSGETGRVYFRVWTGASPSDS